MDEFMKSRMGSKFLEKTMPRIAEALERIAIALEKIAESEEQKQEK